MLSGDSDNPDELYNALENFIKDIPSIKIDEDLFEGAKRNLIGQYIYMLNSIESTAQNYTTSDFSGNDFYQMIDTIKSFDISVLDEVKELFKNVIITKFEIFPNEENE